MPNILCKWIPSAIIKQENKYHYLNNSYNHKENEGVIHNKISWLQYFHETKT